MPRLFLDCDGVFADFNGYFEQEFHASPEAVEAALGTQTLYALLRQHEDFYFKLPLMVDAKELYAAVAHLSPTILTGHPNVAAPEWAIEQKQRWTAKHFPGVRTIVCPSREKYKHMEAHGDVLVDDRLKYMHYWVDAGGVFLHHTSSASTIGALRELELL